jgi:hypothetical protein
MTHYEECPKCHEQVAVILEPSPADAVNYRAKCQSCGQWFYGVLFPSLHAQPASPDGDSTIPRDRKTRKGNEP